MQTLAPLLERERTTINAMIVLYCHTTHGTSHGSLCAECQKMADYTQERLRRCPFQDQKPTCANCTVHCYQPAMRAQIRVIMRVAGPRMLLRHPYLAVRHLWDGRKRTPQRARKAARNE